MITVEQALEKILSHVNTLESEKKPLLQSLGQVLAEDVYSTINVPPLDNSAMDGYAVRSQDTKDASQSSPKILRVISEVAAGYLIVEEVVDGTAIRIMTGAPIPKGADAVVRFEDTDEEDRKLSGHPLTEIGILSPVKKWLNVRWAAEDIARGSLVLKEGTLLRPQEIGVLASLGIGVVSVIRRPVIAILATGDELVDITQPLPMGKIYNSNTYSLAAQVIYYGGIPKILGIAADNTPALVDKITQCQDADLLITSAGVSMGEYDMVKEVLAQLGDISFWTVRMKPGKPLAFGVLRLGNKRVPHLGLPGNPVSSMVVFEQLARPAIQKLMGMDNFSNFNILAVSESHIENTDGRRFFVRVKVIEQEGQYFARSVGSQGSGILTSMVKANGLMVIPEDKTSVSEGELVQVQMTDWSQIGSVDWRKNWYQGN